MRLLRFSASLNHLNVRASCKLCSVMLTVCAEFKMIVLTRLQTSSMQLQQCVSRLQFLESSTVSRSIVSKQEARVCDLENKLEFQKGQVKRFEVRSDHSFISTCNMLVFLLDVA